MSRWGKNIVVPLDSLCKEKENTNRPTVTRSVGTVGKWGKMGFTSTRTYALAALPATLAAASPSESPSSALDDDMSPSIPEPPKPKKFFKSITTAPPEVIAQIIQQLPRIATSPNRESSSYMNTSSQLHITSPQARSDTLKIKLAKSNSAERKKKAAPKPIKVPSTRVHEEPTSDASESAASVDSKPKKKKEEKKLKPEAPPSRVIARTRKTVNYCEDDEDERTPTPIKDIIVPKNKSVRDEELLPRSRRPSAEMSPPAKSLEHRPIVLRISKGTSCIVSTDNEESTSTPSPPRSTDAEAGNLAASPEASQAAQNDTAAAITTTPITTSTTTTTTTILNAELRPPAAPASILVESANGSPEINYSSVKISPDKPPKERLKLIIKTDVIRNAIAAAAAAANKANELEHKMSSPIAASAAPEKKTKSKHRHKQQLKHSNSTALEATLEKSEFKAPSPNVASTNGETRTVISPAVLSERDFDSQSSVLGSISSKGNSTPQLGAQAAPEESYVVHSRGSSVITSDLETSQHSSLVAPPSDIESRLESMMMDGGAGDLTMTRAIDPPPPLNEDILSLLRGDESQTCSPLTNGDIENKTSDDEATLKKRRQTRGRGRPATKRTVAESEVVVPTRLRNRKTAEVEALDETANNNNTRGRRAIKKSDETSKKLLDDVQVKASPTPPPPPASSPSPTKCEEENIPIVESVVSTLVTRRGRPQRNARNNNNACNNHNNNNYNINKIADNLSAKAGAAEEAAKNAALQQATANAVVPSTPRSYGRKRKNQQVMQVLQPSAEELEQHPHPAKMSNMEAIASELHYTHELASSASLSTRPLSTNSGASPPRHDYKVKDKFKRTIMLDNNQGSCDAVITSPLGMAYMADMTDVRQENDSEEQQQRGSVKLVISKKKGSIFKSRTLVPADQTEQAGVAKRHLYKHRWDHEANDTSSREGRNTPTTVAADKQLNPASRATTEAIYDDFDEAAPNAETQNCDTNSAIVSAKITRGNKINALASSVTNNSAFSMEVEENNRLPLNTDLASSRRSKDYYTVVRNVKTAHQIQEIGEYQEMDDDVEYILDALQPHNPMSTRCLSALQLASKCMTTAFRMHVRAHGIVAKFFKVSNNKKRFYFN